MSIRKIFNRKAMKRIGVYGTLLSAAILINNNNTALQWGKDTSLPGKINRAIQLNVNHKNCTSVGSLSSAPKGSRRDYMGQAIEAISKTPTGKMLVDFARKKDVRFCEHPVSEDPGVFTAKLGLLGVNLDLSDPSNGSYYVMAHELFHPVQMYDFNYKRLSAKDRVVYTLILEGAAEVTAIRVAHEMKERGDMRAWDWYNKRLPQDYHLLKSFYDSVYQAVLNNNQNKTMEEAEDIASRATYRMYFSSPLFNARLVRIVGTLKDVANAQYQRWLSRTDPLSIEDMRNVAKLPNGFDFVGDHNVLPHECDIDAGVILIRQAISAAHAFYHDLDFDDDPTPEITYGIFKDIDMNKVNKIMQTNSEARNDTLLAMILAQGYRKEDIKTLLIQANSKVPKACPSNNHFGFQNEQKKQNKNPGRPQKMFGT